MLVTKNRAAAQVVSLLAIAIFLAACSPPGPRALLAGKDLLDEGKTAEAVQELQIATSLMPTNAAAWNYLGVAYHRTGQWTNAADAYSRALRHNRELLEVRFNLGCLWLDQNKLEEAKAEFTAYTLRRPNAGEGWLKLGATQLRARDVAAEKSFREALRINLREIEALNGLGLVFVQRNRPRDAADSFGAALKLQSDYRPALLNLATVLQQQLNDRAGALQRYREYLALQPRDESWEAVNAIVRSLEPAVVARPALVSNITAAPATTNLSRALVAPSSRPAAQPKSELQTNVAKILVATPPIARGISNPPPPAAEVVKLAPEPVIKATPDDKPAVARPTGPVVNVASNSAPTKMTTPVAPERKSLLSKLNPFKRDAKPLVESVAAPSVLPVGRDEGEAVAGGRYKYVSPAIPKSGDRKSAEQALAKGQEAQRARRLAEAIQYYRRAAQLDGSYFEAHYSLGLAAFESRSFKVAAGAWETALAIQPDSSDARYNFALTLKADGHPKEAAAELEKLLGLHPDEARGYLTLGNLYAEQLGDKPRARLNYNKVLQLDPRNPQAQAIRYWLVANPA